jgi:hypothetical protein
MTGGLIQIETENLTMRSSKTDQLIADYLHRVRLALEHLTPSRRDEILEDLTQHITEARSHFSSDSEAELRTLLDHLGSPAEIAEAAGVRPHTSKIEPWVPWMLVFGAFVFFVGWLIGLVMLWSSQTWRLRDKLLGTLIWPGGLLFPLFLGGVGGSSDTCQGTSSSGSVHCATHGGLPAPLSTVIIIMIFLAPILVAVHLDRVRRRRAV